MESPSHDRDLSVMSVDEVQRVVETWYERYRLLRATHAGPVVLFRNRGRAAGASLSHPHTQLVAMEAAPPRFRSMARRAADWFTRRGSCLICDLPRIEPEWEARVVHDEGDVVAFVPWAPETSLEVWILPRRHTADLGGATPTEIRALGRTLGRVLSALRGIVPDPPYNLVLHSPAPSADTVNDGHWFVKILPRTNQIAGFELSSGVRIVSTLPEADADLLRAELPKVVMDEAS